VSNEWNPQLAPRAGEHVFPGGIYRDVHLLVTDPLHVAWHGTLVTTPQASPEYAVVRIRTEVRNDSPVPTTCKVECRVIDRTFRVVAATIETRVVRAGETVEFDQTTNPIAKPLLWQPDNPQLYLLHTQVLDGERLADRYDTRFGIRSFQWTADRGFFLNGEHLYLRGANVHQDHAGWGIAITRAACERDVRLMKEAGFNFVRGAHYPHHPAFADACDRLGMLFWSENCFWGKGGFGPEGYWSASAYPVNEADMRPFEESCKDALREMIRINRNHPSIVAWSMTNEAFFTYHLHRAKGLMSDLVALSHTLDPTRPAAIGGAQRGDVDTLGDVAGYNGDGARLFLNPGVANMVSEYGAISKPHDAYDPFWGELQTQRFPWRAGQAIWAGADYGSIAGRQGLKGIINHQRLPKRSWHWYRNEYLGIAPPSAPIDGVPAKLRLEADKTTIVGADATDDVQLIVTVLDANDRHLRSTPPITLTIESGPGEFPTGRAITFAADSDIGIADGQAAIAFRSYRGGRSLIRAKSLGLASASIEITTEGEPAFAEGVTPLVLDRPYIPPPVSEAAKRAIGNAVNVALNRPSRASSEAKGHPARSANDGDPATCWRAGKPLGDWTVDLEGFYQLASLRLAFPEEANVRFVVELSTDAQSWTVAIDRSGTENTRAVCSDVFPPGAVARHVRVKFLHVPSGVTAGLRDIEVIGVLSVR
ncbi:MAG: glycoside hydrolase family 2 TIM barrel-domain containing protein, partial [Tepidisphaeraceae bacterium]